MVMNTIQVILSAAEQLSAFTGDNIHIDYRQATGIPKGAIHMT
jgi:hypothetical protein